MTNEIKKHAQPLWRERANYRLAMKIDDATNEEELWVRKHSDELFEICCVPFFIYDMHLGDIIKIVPHENKNLVLGVQTPSGHHTFRIWFQTKSVDARETVLEALAEQSCGFEKFDDNLLAVDASDDQSANALARWLESNRVRLGFDYETGRTE